jgi:hypothetical protein
MQAALLLGLADAALGAPFQQRAFCDVPTAVLSSASAPSADACAERCASTPGCGVFSFVSGWDRCLLHAPTGVRVTVHLLAGAIETSASGVRAAGPVRADSDHTGRDLEKAPRDLPSVETCAAACVETSTCTSYVYVQGYRSCWLKGTPGEFTPKTFTCGWPNPAG